MNRLLLFILAFCLLTGCRSSRTASSSMEQHLTSSVVQTSDSVGFSLAHQLQRMLGEGTLSARIIRFYPSADSLPPVIIPDSPLPASSESSLPSDNHYQPGIPSSHLGPMPWLFPFGQVSSITDIHFDWSLLHESGSSHINASASNDSINKQKSIDAASSQAKAVKADGLPWYKWVIIFVVLTSLCFVATVLLRG